MKKIFLYSVVALGTLVTSCRSMDDNISPNSVDPALITPRESLAASQNLVFISQAGTLNSLSNVWSNTWAGNDYYFGNPLAVEYSLDITNTFGNGIWNSSYIASANLQNIINKGDQYPYHAAIARILKAYQMQYVVDFYGDAPYSEAYKGQENLTPKYDDDASIYRNLVLEINKAVSDISTIQSNSNIEVKSSEDGVFHGDMDSWRKFANNIKLRILLRQSKVTDATIRSFVDAQLQGMSTLGMSDFYTNSVVINPGYSNGNIDQPNPMYNNYGITDFTGKSVNTNGWRTYKVSKYYADFVNGTKVSGGDLRGPKQFGRLAIVPNASSYVNVIGREQGAPKPTGTNEWSISHIGWKFSGNATQAYYAVNGAGEDVAAAGAAMDGYLALNSENKLLLAEAATLYPSIFGSLNAQTLYTNAVSDSFTFYGLTAVQATNYLNALNATVNGWAGAPNKIAAIQFQRLICLANLRQVETYVNFLKTGYPTIPTSLNANQANKPYRLIYPISEYTGNSNNVPNVSQAQVFTKNASTPFWNQN